jgi:hypothetical protein
MSTALCTSPRVIAIQILGQQIPQIYRHTLVLSLAYPGSSSRHIMRRLILTMVAGATTPGSVRNNLQKAAADKDVNVSMSSLFCWRECIDPYHPTGNKAREQVVGVDLINLVTFLKAWQEAHLNEMVVFIYNKGGPLYPIAVISKRMTSCR